jgi:hypothetical protein
MGLLPRQLGINIQKYLLNTYYLPGTILHVRDKVVRQTNKQKAKKQNQIKKIKPPKPQTLTKPKITTTTKN